MENQKYSNERGAPLDARQITRNRFFLVVVFLIPVLTILAATFVFKTGIGMPDATSNKGVLVLPPQQLDDIEIFRKSAARFNFTMQESWAWSIVVPGDGECDAQCVQTLWFTRQLHALVGQKSHRVRRYYLNVGEQNSAAMADLMLREHPKLETLYTSRQQFDRLLAGIDEPLEPIKNNQYFLVDPKGFVMMYYTPEHTGKEVLRDLRFLLKQSGG